MYEFIEILISTIQYLICETIFNGGGVFRKLNIN